MYVIDGIAYAGEPVAGIKVNEARVVNDLCLLVTFSTGEIRVFDASPLLEKPAFRPLEDPQVFVRFTIDHGVICWLDGDIDLAPETLYRMSYAYDRTA